MNKKRVKNKKRAKRKQSKRRSSSLHIVLPIAMAGLGALLLVAAMSGASEDIPARQRDKVEMKVERPKSHEHYYKTPEDHIHFDRPHAHEGEPAKIKEVKLEIKKAESRPAVRIEKLAPKLTDDEIVRQMARSRVLLELNIAGRKGEKHRMTKDLEKRVQAYLAPCRKELQLIKKIEQFGEQLGASSGAQSRASERLVVLSRKDGATFTDARIKVTIRQEMAQDRLGGFLGGLK